MKNINYKKVLIFLPIIMILILGTTKVYATEGNLLPIPKIDITVDGAKTPVQYVDNLKLLIFLTVLTLLPSFLMMMTSFIRISIVFGFLRSALGTQQSPSNQILIGLGIFLTIFIMTPVFNEINKNAIQPYIKNEITQEKAIEEGSKPLRTFMLKQTSDKDLKLFLELAKLDKDPKVTKENAPMQVVIPAFIISELKTAFQIGFLLFIPFLLIDLVVSSVLMSMGMFMLPPVMIALPFKLLLFVMVDGWNLIVKSLIISFH